MSDRAKIVRIKEAGTSLMRRRFLLVFRRDWRVKLFFLLIPLFIVFFILSALVFPVISYDGHSSHTISVNLQPYSSQTYTVVSDIPPGSTYNMMYQLPSGTTANFKLYTQNYSALGLSRSVVAASGNLNGNNNYTFQNINNLHVASFEVKVMNENSFPVETKLVFTSSSTFFASVNPIYLVAGIVTMIISSTGLGLTLLSIGKDSEAYFYKLNEQISASERGRTKKSSFTYVSSKSKGIHPLVFFSITAVLYIIGFGLNHGSGFIALLSYICLGVGTAVFFGGLFFWVIRLNS